MELKMHRASSVLLTATATSESKHGLEAELGPVKSLQVPRAFGFHRPHSAAPAARGPQLGIK